ncbi:hypothetical protein KR009_009464 [Drosophila setifemur]|nr:hypothetical protein KR009_009464 [Drosophila setifemur]
MTTDSNLYYTAFEDLFKELLTIEREQKMEGSGSVLESGSETPKRSVQMRQQKLFTKDSSSFVISRRSPKFETRIDQKQELSPSRRRELLGDQILQLRKDRAEKERKQPRRRLVLRI